MGYSRTGSFSAALKEIYRMHREITSNETFTTFLYRLVEIHKQKWFRISVNNFHQRGKSCKRFIRCSLPMHTVRVTHFPSNIPSYRHTFFHRINVSTPTLILFATTVTSIKESYNWLNLMSNYRLRNERNNTHHQPIAALILTACRQAYVDWAVWIVLLVCFCRALNSSPGVCYLRF